VKLESRRRTRQAGTIDLVLDRIDIERKTGTLLEAIEPPTG
jgi:hypothetical protein